MLTIMIKIMMVLRLMVKRVCRGYCSGEDDDDDDGGVCMTW